MTYSDDIATTPDITAGGLGDWDNLTATDNPGEPTSWAGGGGNNVWQKVFITAAGDYQFGHDTSVNSDDTVMTIYQGPASATYADLVLVGHGDDEGGNSKPLIDYTSPGSEWIYIESSGYSGARVSGQITFWGVVTPPPPPPDEPTVGLWRDWNMVTLATPADLVSVGFGPFIGLGVNVWTELTKLSDGNYVAATPYSRTPASGQFTAGWLVYLLDPDLHVLDHYQTEVPRTDLQGAEATSVGWADGIVVVSNCTLAISGSSRVYVHRVRLDCLGGTITPVWTVSAQVAGVPSPVVTTGTPTLHGIGAVDPVTGVIVGVSLYANSLAPGYTLFFKMIDFATGAYIGEYLQQTEVYLGGTQTGGQFFMLGEQALTAITPGKMRLDLPITGGSAGHVGMCIMGVAYTGSGFGTFDAPAFQGAAFAAFQCKPPSGLTDVVAYFNGSGNSTEVLTGNIGAVTDALYPNLPDASSFFGYVSAEYPQYGSENPTFFTGWDSHSGSPPLVAGALVDGQLYAGPIRQGGDYLTGDGRHLSSSGHFIYAIGWETASGGGNHFVIAKSPDMTDIGGITWHTVGGHWATVGGATMRILTPLPGGDVWVDVADGPG